MFGSRDPKTQGELAELAFLYRAASLGLVVSKPYGDTAPYDFIVGCRRRLTRIQVKSVAHNWRNGYRTTAGTGCAKRPYTKDDMDILALYIIPMDTWYLIPVEAFTPVKTIRCCPHLPNSNGRFERFREAWHLLGERFRRRKAKCEVA